MGENYLWKRTSQFEWYAVNADWQVADRYLIAVETTARHLEQHPCQRTVKTSQGGSNENQPL
jgi:hypothetical protein